MNNTMNNSMNTFIITKADHSQIPCISKIPQGASKIVIVIHGLCSSKESDNAQFMVKHFSSKGLGAIAYDQPGHGTNEAAKEPLQLANCLESLAAVQDYIHTNYPDAEICYFGSSFGAYVLGNFLARSLNLGKKAFMRCAAITFPKLVLGDPTAEPDPQVQKLLDAQGYIDTKIDGQPVRFTKTFLEELRDNSLEDIYDKKLPEASLSFVHGEDDPVVPVGPIKAFAEKHGYPIVVVPGEEHSISNSPDSPTLVGNTAYEFFINE